MEYMEDRLLELQHAIVLQALKDIKTPTLRKTYWWDTWRSLKVYAQCYGMTRSQMVKLAIKSGYIKGMTESEVDEYGE